MASRPTRASESRALAIASAGRTPRRRSGNAAFSAALSDGMRLSPWNTTPALEGSCSGEEPHAGQRTAPDVGWSRPAMRCTRVDLPDPDGPTRATRLLVETVHEASCTATT